MPSIPCLRPCPGLCRLAPILLLAALLAACAGPSGVRHDAPLPPASLLLVSLDGVRPDYLGQGDTPHLDRFAAEGVQAQWMTPSYPALTFPNHYTLVTGLRPDRHGIVHNRMRDAELGTFSLGNRQAVGDSRWWSGEPIWVGAEKAGLPTATLSWPGSEAAIGGVRPTRWFEFDASRSLAERIDTVANWLTEPATTRPRLATLYFEHPDSAGHGHGPDSAEVRQALREVDAALGELFARLATAGALERTNIVVVSDHGMAAVPADQVISTESMVDPRHAALVSAGQVVGFAPRSRFHDEAEAALLGRHEHYECWRKADLPPRWRYGSHPRVPAIVCQMDEGWDALPEDFIARQPPEDGGSHGYDPALPSMRAIFMARGPAFRRGAVLAPFDNVDVYPLLARLLGIEPAAHDGDPATLLPALRSGD